MNAEFEIWKLFRHLEIDDMTRTRIEHVAESIQVKYDRLLQINKDLHESNEYYRELFDHFSMCKSKGYQ